MVTNLTDLHHLFDIARNISNARTAAAKAADDIAFHLGELEAMRLHSDNERVRAVCECITCAT